MIPGGRYVWLYSGGVHQAIHENHHFQSTYKRYNIAFGKAEKSFYTKCADPNCDPNSSKNLPGGGVSASGLFRFRGRILCLQCCYLDSFHSFCRILLGCCRDVSAGIQREPCREVPSILDCYRHILLVMPLRGAGNKKL